MHNIYIFNILRQLQLIFFFFFYRFIHLTHFRSKFFTASVFFLFFSALQTGLCNF